MLYIRMVSPFIYVLILLVRVECAFICSIIASAEHLISFQLVVHQYVNVAAGQPACVACVVMRLISQWQLLMHLFNYLPAIGRLSLEYWPQTRFCRVYYHLGLRPWALRIRINEC